MIKQKLNGNALGLSFAILSILGMIGTWIIGKIGIYSSWVETMIQMHVFFSLSVLGLITGIIEAGIWSFIVGWLVAYFYNKF